MSKYEHESKLEGYIADCLWALATDRRFVDGSKPSLIKWTDFISPRKQQEKPKMDGQEIMDELLSAWNA